MVMITDLVIGEATILNRLVWRFLMLLRHRIFMWPLRSVLGFTCSGRSLPLRLLLVVLLMLLLWRRIMVLGLLRGLSLGFRFSATANEVIDRFQEAAQHLTD